MQAEQKQFLEQRYGAHEWYGRNREKRVVKGFSLDKLELPGWTLHRVQRDEDAKPPVMHSLWRRGDSASELLAIDVFECASAKAAHDQLMEALGNMESGAVERRTGKEASGDVAFGLNDTMVLFARANVVVLIRNAGPKVVGVGEVARAIDSHVLRAFESKRPGKE